MTGRVRIDLHFRWGPEPADGPKPRVDDEMKQRPWSETASTQLSLFKTKVDSAFA